MHAKLMKMMAKKRDLSPSEKKAKMDAVHGMKSAASELMGNKMDGLKRVSVMSNSKPGLEMGLNKAKQIVSDGQEDQMKLNASAPYSDYKHAMAEHNGEEQSDELGRPMYEGGAAEMGYADGGEVESPSKLQQLQDSVKKAFSFGPDAQPAPDTMDQKYAKIRQGNSDNFLHNNYAEGGEVESPDDDESEDGYEARQESDDSEDGSPAEASQSDEGGDEEFHGLDMDSVNEKLEKLMKMKKKMESKRS